MPVLSDSENNSQQVIKNERKETLIKFFSDFKVSFLIWIKLGGIVTGCIIILYLFARFIIKWDILYETNVNYSTVFLVAAAGSAVSIAACWLVAFFLYNTKHRRGTKYKSVDTDKGGERDA